MQLHAATAEGLLEALVGARDEAVERDGHMTGGFAHAGSTSPLRGSHRCTRAPLLANRQWEVWMRHGCDEFAVIRKSLNRGDSAARRTALPKDFRRRIETS